MARSRTTRKTYDPKFKMKVALEVYRGDRTLSQVASDNRVSPSLACEWRDEPLGAGDAVFGRSKAERERKAEEEAAAKERGRMLMKIGQLERDFLQRFCDREGLDRSRREAAADAALRGALSRKRSCELLGVGRGGTYRAPARRAAAAATEGDEERMAEIDRIHIAHPAYGARKVARELAAAGLPTSRWKAGELMRRMNVRPCCPMPSLSRPAKGSRRFPYLLRGKEVRFPNQVWSTDITYVQIGRGHMYLTAVIDWFSRKVVSWRLSDNMRAVEVCRCAEAAFSEFGTPSIMNSDQGSVFGSDEYVALLAADGIAQSMDGRARWTDNVLMERWFRTLKSEYLRNSEYSTPRELESVIAAAVEDYSSARIHASPGYETPDSWYGDGFGVAA